MKSFIKRTLTLLFVVGLAIFTYAASGRAQTTDQVQSQFTITPVIYENSAKPGEVVTNKVKVSNNTDTPIVLGASAENILRTNVYGEVELTKSNTPYELASWTTVEPKQFTVKPRGTQEVSYTFTVPMDASPGGHYGAILIGTPPTQVKDNGAAVVQRIGSLLLIRVSGQANEEASVSSFRTKTFSGTWEEVVSSDGNTRTLVPQNEDRSKERFQRYFSKGPVAFDAVIKNSGNVHVKPMGFVSIYNIFNKKVAELPLNSQNVFPNSERNLTIIWPEKKPRGIYYRAQLSGLYGSENNKVLAATTAFWAFPLGEAIAIGVALIIIILIRRRLWRALIALFSRDHHSPDSPAKQQPTEPKTESKSKDTNDNKE